MSVIRALRLACAGIGFRGGDGAVVYRNRIKSKAALNFRCRGKLARLEPASGVPDLANWLANFGARVTVTAVMIFPSERARNPAIKSAKILGTARICSGLSGNAALFRGMRAPEGRTAGIGSEERVGAGAADGLAASAVGWTTGAKMHGVSSHSNTASRQSRGTASGKMRRVIAALVVAAVVGLGPRTSAMAATGNCTMRDSALCIANPNCHWDYQGRGCSQGAPAHQDPCVVHEDSKVCDTDVTLGCRWNSEKKQCESAN